MPISRTRIARDIWWVFLAILVVNAVLVSLNIWRTTRNEAEVADTLRLVNLLNRLQNYLVDGETAARGFLVTGRDEFLTPYRESIPKVPELLAELKQLTANNESLQRQLNLLTPAMDHRVAILERTIAAGRQEVRDPAKEKDLVTEGKHAMDESRGRIGSMRDEEMALLDRRGETARTAFFTSIYTATIGGALSIGMLLMMNYLMHREREVRRGGEESLKLSEERFRLIAESLPQFVWVTRPDGHYEFCNHRWLEYTGQSPDKSLGYGWSSPVHPDDRTHYEKLWKHALATGEPVDTEARFQRPDGTSRWFLVRVAPMRDRAGRIERWLGTAGDIDDQIRANEELEIRVRERTGELQRAISELVSESNEREKATGQLHRTAAELGRSNEELEKFAYIASHDLQEPLRKIQAFGDRLKIKCRDQLDEQGREYIDRMKSSATRMRRLIDDLLSFSRVTTRPADHSEVDLNVVAQEVLNDLEDAILRTGATVDIGALPIIEADASQMRQMLQNLLTNALKFHKPDETPQVTVRASTLGSMPDDPSNASPRTAVRIDVIDRGIGFDNEFRERIFEVFQRLHGRNEFEGTGIGLAVVRKIAERHGGFVTADGAAGEGATFSVVLPMRGSANNDSSILRTAPVAQTQ